MSFQFALLGIVFLFIVLQIKLPLLTEVLFISVLLNILITGKYAKKKLSSLIKTSLFIGKALNINEEDEENVDKKELAKIIETTNSLRELLNRYKILELDF